MKLQLAPDLFEQFRLFSWADFPARSNLPNRFWTLEWSFLSIFKTFIPDTPWINSVVRGLTGFCAHGLPKGGTDDPLPRFARLSPLTRGTNFSPPCKGGEPRSGRGSIRT